MSLRTKKNNIRKGVLIIGTIPETAGIGGVSIHVQRLMQWLEFKNFNYSFCDYKIVPVIKQLQRILQYKVVHIHISRPWVKFLYVVFCKLVNVKSILTIHGNIGRYSYFDNYWEKQSITLCNIPILINSNSYELARKWNKNSTLISAFLPPQKCGDLPAYVKEAISWAKESGKTVIACNASKRSFTINGDEIYGIDFIIRFLKDKDDYFLCISDPSGQYSKHYHDEILKHVLFIKEPHSFYELLKLCDVMLRPTATDGDSLSVREGLYLHKIVLATDCVDSPDGVILFHYNDCPSLEDALLKSQSSEVSSVCVGENSIEQLIRVYRYLL